MSHSSGNIASVLPPEGGFGVRREIVTTWQEHSTICEVPFCGQVAVNAFREAVEDVRSAIEEGDESIPLTLPKDATMPSRQLHVSSPNTLTLLHPDIVENALNNLPEESRDGVASELWRALSTRTEYMPNGGLHYFDQNILSKVATEQGEDGIIRLYLQSGSRPAPLEDPATHTLRDEQKKLHRVVQDTVGSTPLHRDIGIAIGEIPEEWLYFDTMLGALHRQYVRAQPLTLSGITERVVEASQLARASGEDFNLEEMLQEALEKYDPPQAPRARATFNAVSERHKRFAAHLQRLAQAERADDSISVIEYVIDHVIERVTHERPDGGWEEIVLGPIEMHDFAELQPE